MFQVSGKRQMQYLGNNKNCLMRRATLRSVSSSSFELCLLKKMLNSYIQQRCNGKRSNTKVQNVSSYRKTTIESFIPGKQY